MTYINDPPHTSHGGASKKAVCSHNCSETYVQFQACRLARTILSPAARQQCKVVMPRQNKRHKIGLVSLSLTQAPNQSASKLLKGNLLETGLENGCARCFCEYVLCKLVQHTCHHDTYNVATTLLKTKRSPYMIKPRPNQSPNTS